MFVGVVHINAGCGGVARGRPSFTMGTVDFVHFLALFVWLIFSNGWDPYNNFSQHMVMRDSLSLLVMLNAGFD